MSCCHTHRFVLRLLAILTAPELRFFASLRMTFSRRSSVILSETKDLSAFDKDFCKRSIEQSGVTARVSLISPDVFAESERIPPFDATTVQ